MLGSSRVRFSCGSFCVRGRVLAALFVCGAAANVALAQPISFSGPFNLPVGSKPEAIVVADFNGDNVLDLAVANGGSNSVSILLGNPDGSFQDPVDYAVGTYPWFITVADLNGDNIRDLVVSNRDSQDVMLLFGVGDGTFVNSGSISFEGNPFSTVVNDFTSGGVQDLVVSNTFSAFYLSGNGNGSFGMPAELLGPNARFVATADFNGDGIPDLAITNARGVDSISILLGTGRGTFELVGNFAVG